VTGLVENSISWTWEEFQKLPRASRKNDVHCVTHWTKLDNDWEGVTVREVLRLARPKPEARFVVEHAIGRWTTNVPLEDFDRDENLFATHHGGKPLTREHGAPMRVVIPRLYFSKGAKWVSGIELVSEDRLGFWEENGYHMRGDPWKEERFRDG
jgi:DMSO/TMAO reductase YedYZ molybdopterin-dependent catalytic subunit